MPGAVLTTSSTLLSSHHHHTATNQISHLSPQIQGEMSTAISSPALYGRMPSNSQIVRTSSSSSSSIIYRKSTNNRHGRGPVGMLWQNRLIPPRYGFRCNCSSTPGGPAPGDNESKRVLDAFFLGKALAEALNERIESTVGEFLSAVGRLQAEQQKQVQEFQDEVLERAKKAKEKAAREAMEAQGLVPKPSASNTTSSTNTKSRNASITGSSATDESTTSSSPSSNDQSLENGNTDPLLGISIDD